MKKSLLLFGAMAAVMVVNAQDAVKPVLQDVTPWGYNFDNYEDGQQFKVHSGVGDATSGSYWTSKMGIYDPEAVKQDGHFTTLIWPGGDNVALNSPANIAEDNAGITVRDFGGYLGKCLVINQPWSPLATATEGNPVAMGSTKNRATTMGIGLYCDKDSVHHDWAGHAIRVRLVLNVMRRGCHATGQGDKGMKTAFGFSEILAADNDGEAGGYYCPSIEFDSESGVLFPEAGVGINGSEFAKWENEGTCLAEMPAEIKPIMNTEQDPFDNPGHACAAGDHYHMQLDRFMVYEWDVYMTGANQNLKLNLTFESGNMSIVIKEIKFFNITNADELLVFPDPTDRSNYEFGPSSLIGKRSKSWRYYTEKGVKEFAEEVAEPAEEDGLTAETAWQISTPEDIEAMKDKVSAAAPTYFKLMNDIDMTGINHIPTVGSQNVDFGKTIYFDGNNHVISNLTSVAENEEFYYASLFGVFQGEVKNLGLVDVNLKSNLGVAGIGGYVGYGSDKGIVDGVIDNCYVT
ncbi:MAG: hypothetical protein K2J07_06270, partial [Muribaculaceae bacterium]|nr:hypothetical protein [Muribaculaceae bacterium]